LLFTRERQKYIFSSGQEYDLVLDALLAVSLKSLQMRTDLSEGI